MALGKEILRFLAAPLLMGILSIPGVLLTMAWFSNDSLGLSDRELRHSEGELVAIKDLLRDYRERHGRYPSNDEGLSSLDGFTFRGTQSVRAGFICSDFWGEYWNREPNDRRQAVAACLRDGMPEQQAIRCVGLFGEETKEPEAGLTRVDYVLSAKHDVFITSPVGILSPWLLPYMYENRTGSSAAQYAASPVNAGERDRFCIEIDSGVFLYSVGALVTDELHAPAAQKRGLMRVSGPALLILALVVWFLQFRRGWKNGLGTAGAFLALVVVCCIILLPSTVRYGPHTDMHPFIGRSPAMVDRQKGLLASYRAKGVISEETYRKHLATIDTPCPPANAQDPNR